MVRYILYKNVFSLMVGDGKIEHPHGPTLGRTADFGWPCIRPLMYSMVVDERRFLRSRLEMESGVSRGPVKLCND